MALFKKTKNTTPKRQGFSLVEVLISFTILSISLIAITQLITSSIQANQLNTARIQAYYLAQQGIENIRHIRDSNWQQNIGFNSAEFQNQLWVSNNGSTSNITPSEEKELIVDIQPSTIGNIQKSVSLAEANSTNEKIYLNQDPQTNLYYFSHNSTGQPTQFKRVITIKDNFPDLNKLEQNLQLQTLTNKNDVSLESNFILVESKVYYGQNYDKEISLKTILTDWKQGPL